MPRRNLYVQDFETKKTYDMPWDRDQDPSEDEIVNFISSRENEGTMSKIGRTLTTPLSDIGSRTMKKYISDPIREYQAGGELRMLGRTMAPAASKQNFPEGSWRKSISDFDRSLGRGAAPVADFVGESVIDQSMSPAGLALLAAGPAGKGIQMVGGASAVGTVGKGLTYLPKAAGYGYMAHGAKGEYDAMQNPDATWKDYAAPAVEMAGGYLGARAPRAGSVPKAAPSSRTVGSVVGDGFPGEIKYPGGRPLPKGPVIEPMSYGPRTSRPSTQDWIHDPISEPPVTRFPSSGETIVDDFPGQLKFGSGNRTPPRAPSIGGYEQPNYRPQGGSILERDIADTFESAVPRKGVPDSPAIPSDLTPEGLASRQKASATAAREARMAEEIDAENLAAGFGETKTKVPKARAPMSEEALARGRTPTTNPKSLKKAAKKYKTFKEFFESIGGGSGDKKQRGSTLSMFGAGQGSDIGRIAKETLEDISSLSDRFEGGVGKLKSKAGSLRQKALENLEASEKAGMFGSGKVKEVAEKARKSIAALTGKDITDASFKHVTSSGWHQLDKMGEPGKALSRLLARERIDTSIDLAAARKAGAHLTNEKGVPINRTGGLVYENNQERITELLNKIPEGNQRDRAKSIIDRFRGAEPNQQKAFSKPFEALKTMEAATKLSQFRISNLAGLGPTSMRNKLGEVVKQTKRAFTDVKGAYDEAAESGIFNEIDSLATSELGEGGMKKLLDKAYGISKSEEKMRTIATLSGKATAKDVFAKLKASPTNKYLRRQLDDLVLPEDMDALLQQSELTPRQLLRAGGRMNELTQGLAESIDLPPLWSGHPIPELMLQFKKFGFMQGRNMKLAFKANPVRTLATLATVFPVLGEGIGDVKAGIKGAAKTVLDDNPNENMLEGAWKEIKDRGAPSDRYWNDMSQAWAWGLLGDLYKAGQRGPTGLSEAIAGPTGSDASKTWYGLNQLKDKGQGYHLGRQAASAVPVIGQGLSARVQGSYEGRQGRKKRSPTSRKDRRAGR